MADLTDIDGIAEGRKETMKENGFDSVAVLAEADPSHVADVIPRVTEDRATTMVLQAENIVEAETVDETVDVDDSDVLGPLGNDSDESDDSEERSEPIVTSKDASDETDDESSEEPVSDESDDVDEEQKELQEQWKFDVPTDDNRVETEVVTALTVARENYENRQPDRARTCSDLLDQYREFGLSFTLTYDELNVLHAALQNRENTYKGKSQLEYMRLLKGVRESLQTVRDKAQS